MLTHGLCASWCCSAQRSYVWLQVEVSVAGNGKQCSEGAVHLEGVQLEPFLYLRCVCVCVCACVCCVFVHVHVDVCLCGVWCGVVWCGDTYTVLKDHTKISAARPYTVAHCIQCELYKLGQNGCYYSVGPNVHKSSLQKDVQRKRRECIKLCV